MNRKLLNSILVVSANISRGFLWLAVIRSTGIDLYGDITTFNIAITYTSIFIGLELFRVVNRPLLDDDDNVKLYVVERLMFTSFSALVLALLFLVFFGVTGGIKELFWLYFGTLLLENINLELGRIFNFKNLYLPTTIGNGVLTLFIPGLILLCDIKSIHTFLLITVSIGGLRLLWFLGVVYNMELTGLFKIGKVNFKDYFGKYKTLLPFILIAFTETLIPVYDRIMLKRFTDILGLFSLFSMMFALAPMIFESYFVYPKFKILKVRFVDENDRRLLFQPIWVAVLLLLGLIFGVLFDKWIYRITGEELIKNMSLLVFLLPMILLSAMRSYAYLLFYFSSRQMEYVKIYLPLQLIYIITTIILSYVSKNFVYDFFRVNIIINFILILILYVKLYASEES